MINWFARNGVSANLLMGFLILGGLLSIPQLEMEMFPEFSLDTVAVTVPYPGATPSEVEEGIVLRVEDAVQGIKGIKRVSSTAAEGFGRVMIEIESGYALNEVKENIKTRVDAITTLPGDAERPTVEEFLFPRDVLFIAIAGDTDEATLRQLGERVREDLVAIPGISQSTLLGAREYEISIEVSEGTLREYGLTFDEVVQAVRASSIDLPGGSIKAESGEILLRTIGQAYVGDDFAGVVLRVKSDGTRIVLGDIATVVDGFVDQDTVSRFDGQPAVFVQVQEAGEESPLDISAKVSRYLESARSEFPEGIRMVKFADTSFYLADRLSLLVNNGMLGLLLVLIVLTAFLRPLLAIFVGIGIPVSFLGTVLIAPYIGLTMNMVSLFAFVLVLGIVVDDAIVVGESVFAEYQRNGPGVESAVRGTHLVSTPVTFAVLTTIAAFVPLFFLPGVIGKFFFQIPLVVIATLLFSLVQSKLVLPYHMTLIKSAGTHRAASELNLFQRLQRLVANGLEHFVVKLYRPTLKVCLDFRYATLMSFIVIGAVTIALVGGGYVRQVQFPVVPSDYVQVTLEYPAGTSIGQVEAGIARVEAGLQQVVAEVREEGGEDPVQNESVFTQGETHQVLFLLELTKSEARQISAVELTDAWRAAIGQIPGAKSLTFVADTSPTGEKPIDVQLVGRDFERLKEAAREIKVALAEIPAVFDLADDFSSGKREIKLEVKPQAELLGVTSVELGRQVRSAFYGAEAQRVQRGRNEVKVMVRYPREERGSVGDLEAMRIRLPDGSAVPFSEVAEAEIGQGFSSIQRIDRQRVLNITADIDEANANVPIVTEQVRERVEAILARYPMVTSSLEGQTAEFKEFMGSLVRNGLLMLLAIYILLAVPLKSYIQPVIVMLAIPFALVGAVFGHLVTGQALSMLSYMGIIAAIGVVVNDSLVLVDYVNQRRKEGLASVEAAKLGAERRFRPVFLTSLTTFVGLIPILLETSLQAQFLIPMATSLAFGVLFATFITLLLVPATYMMLEDFRKIGRWIWRLYVPAPATGFAEAEVQADR